MVKLGISICDYDYTPILPEKNSKYNIGVLIPE
jgi:hypothetical protein